MKPSFSVILLVALTLPAFPQGAPKSDVPEDTHAPAPATLIGQSSVLRPLGESSSPNYVSGGIAISQMYTDNAELTTTNTISDLSYNIVPHLAFSAATPRLTYNAGVLAGFLVNRTLNERNQATQNGDFDLSYRVAQFVTVRFSDRFTNSTGLWSGAGVGTGTTGAGIGTLQQPNNSLFTFGRFRTNVVLAELSGQFTAESYAGVRGTQSYLQFPSAATDPVLGTLYGGNSYSAEAYYNHHFSVRNWGGIVLRAQRFDVNRIDGRTDAASLLFMYAANFTPTTSLTFFGGPELSVSSVPQGLTSPPPAFDRRLWSPVAGAVFGWQGQRTSVSASFARQISNGGGLPTVVTLTSGVAQVMHRIGRRLEIGPGFIYGHNVPILPGSTIRTYSGEFQATYHVSNYSFNTGYARDDRTAVDRTTAASANRVWVSFSYDFVRPLGR